MAQKTLVEQKQAVSLFLESLLRDVPEESATTSVALQTVAEVLEPEVQTAVELKGAVSTQIHEKKSEISTSECRQSITPAWANEPFQALLFKVGGLSLAVPLTELSGVVEWPQEITEIPGHADFYIGVYPHQGRNVPVVDTALMVFPAERREGLLRQHARQRITRIILIDNAKYGLGCDEVGEVLTLSPEQVKWRSAQTKRRWLSGTVLEHMCALVDTRSFVEMFLKRH